MRDGYISADLTGKVVSVNPAFAKSLGYESIEDFKNTVPQIQDLYVYPEEHERLFKVLIKHKKAESRKLFFYKKNGESIVLEGNLRLVFLADGEPSYTEAIFESLEFRKSIEASVIRKEENFNSLLNQIQGMVYRCKNNTKWSMIFASEGTEELTGYPKEAFIRDQVFLGEITHKEDADEVWDAIQEATSRKKPYELEFRIHTKKEGVKWVFEKGAGVFSSKGQLLYLEGFITDITEKKNSENELIQKNQELETLEEELRQQSEELSTINENLNQVLVQKESTNRRMAVERAALNKSAIVSTTDVNGSITDANYNFCKISGYKLNELIGSKHSIVNSGYHSKSFYKNLWGHILNGKPWRSEICNRSKEGKIYWIDQVIIPFEDESKNPYQYFALAFDITEKKKVESDLKRAYEEMKISERDLLEQTEEMIEANRKLEELNEEKDGLMSIVAHDLKSPFKKIKGFLNLINLVEDEGEKKTYMQMIEDVILGGEALINDLLEINALSDSIIEPKYSEYCLIEELQASLDGFRDQASKKHIELNLSLTHNEICILSDKFAINRIIDNLVSNAIKFSNQNSEINVFFDQGEEDVKIIVQDFGPGISEEDQQKMFKKFQRLTAVPTAGESSTGLGLYIVKKLAESIGGKIELQSKLGEGSIFTLTIPIGH